MRRVLAERKARRKNRLKPLVCARCGQPIEVLVIWDVLDGVRRPFHQNHAPSFRDKMEVK